MTPFNILLIQMPWATVLRPSIGLAILKALCAERSIPAAVLYPNLDLTAEIGIETAQKFSDERSLFGLSEHLFAVDIFGPQALESDAFLQMAHGPLETDALKTLRDEIVPAFLERTARRILACDPTVVGFTATFNQVMPSLALAARLKKERPAIEIIAGGACFDGEMGREYHRALPDVLDHVFIGEAEDPFREYLQQKLEGRSTNNIAGITSFVAGRLAFLAAPTLADMERSPTPDYDDFFSEKTRVQSETGKQFELGHLPFESARGCWWGAKNQCTFCGINPDVLPFRPKKIDTVVADIVHLSSRYGSVRLTATDWILSRWHCDELFRRLRDLNLDLQIFYELRADMTKAQMKLMREAGVVEVQPGIESFSTELLRLMKKGTSRIRHVQFLRWAREFLIHTAYNILAGFPGEKPEWYAAMADFIPRIAHLQPPMSNVNPIEMHRFAPLFEQGETFGVDMRALRVEYQHNFPKGMVDEQKIGYFFEFHSTAQPDTRVAREAVTAALAPWIASWEARSLPVYDYALGPDFIQISDTRAGKDRSLYLAGLPRDVLLLCDAIQTRERLQRDLKMGYPHETGDGTLDRVIDELLAGDVLMAEGNQLLALPIGRKPRTTEELRRRVLGATYLMEPRLHADKKFAIA